MGEIERECVRMTEAAQDAALQGERLRLEEFQLHAALKIGCRSKRRGDERVEECVLGGGDFSGFAKGLPQTRVVVTFERGQQAGTHTIAEKLRTEVGGVLTKWLTEGEQVSFDLLAGGGEQGTDEARGVRFIVRDRFASARIPTFARRRRMWATRRVRHPQVRREIREIEGTVDSGEPAGSGSAEESEEDGFSLIVTRVGGGNAVEVMSRGGALEKSVAGAASGGFEREMKERGERGDIIGFNGGVERELRGEFGNEASIGVGVGSAKTVVEVEDMEHYAEARGKFGEGSQQSYGVGAAADGHTDALAGTDETMLA